MHKESCRVSTAHSAFLTTRFDFPYKDGKWIPAPPNRSGTSFAGMTVLFDVKTSYCAVFEIIAVNPDKEKVGEQKISKGQTQSD